MSVMNKNILQCFILFVAAALNQIRCDSNNNERLEIDQYRKDFIELEKRLWSDLEQIQNQVGKESLPEVALIKEYEQFGKRLTKAFPNDITHGLEAIQGSWVWARAYGELRTIYALYESFKRFQTQQTMMGRVPSPKQAWTDLAETILNDTISSIPHASERLNNIIVKEKLYRSAVKEVESSMQCSMHESPQQMVLNLYNTVALTELKGYSMVQFSYMLLKLYNKGNFTKEAEIMKERYQERARTSLQSIKDVVKIASREMWICDPKTHVKNKTYIEITELLQGYVQNEVDLNPEGTCRENCAEYTYTKSHSCYKNLFCREQRRCNGKVINCQFIDSDAWICPSKAGTHRRYEFIEYENGRTLGRKMACEKGSTKVDSWWRWLFWHCSYCLCICDEQGPNSDRYINMRTTESDIINNKVVTGMRFIKKNRIVHLQVQEGKLLGNARIDQSTVKWVDVENYKIMDKGIYNGQDYHTLTWENRALDLDDLIGEEGQVLTGVRFKLIGSHLNFEIRLTPFQYSTGKLSIDKSVWKDNPNTDVNRLKPSMHGLYKPIRLKKLNLEKLDIPIRSPSHSVPDSKNDQYIEFTHTDLDRDVAQTTVPFIDAQSVENIQPVPLSGAGIYHKGRANFGGFIAPKIITYDFSKLLDTAINDLEIEY